MSDVIYPLPPGYGAFNTSVSAAVEQSLKVGLRITGKSLEISARFDNFLLGVESRGLGTELPQCGPGIMPR